MMVLEGSSHPDLCLAHLKSSNVPIGFSCAHAHVVDKKAHVVDKIADITAASASKKKELLSIFATKIYFKP